MVAVIHNAGVGLGDGELLPLAEPFDPLDETPPDRPKAGLASPRNGVSGPPGGHVAFLALQLRFDMSVSCLCLMGSSPERPCDEELRLDSPSSKTRGDAADCRLADRLGDDRAIS